MSYLIDTILKEKGKVYQISPTQQIVMALNTIWGYTNTRQHIDEDGEFHATIAGVNKKLAPEELESYGGSGAFRIGFTFSHAGGTESVYNDTVYGDYTVENHKIKITQNVVIRPSTYTIGITDEYRRILADARTLKEFKETFDKN